MSSFSSAHNSPNTSLPSPKASNRTIFNINRSSSSLSEHSLQDTSLDRRELQELREWQDEVGDEETPTNRHPNTRGLVQNSLLDSETDESDSSKSSKSSSSSGSSVKKRIPPPAPPRKPQPKPPSNQTQQKTPNVQKIQKIKEPTAEKQAVKPSIPPPAARPLAPPLVESVRKAGKSTTIAPPQLTKQTKPSKTSTTASKSSPAVLVVPGLLLGLLVTLKVMLDTTGKVDKLHFSVLEILYDSVTKWGDVLDKLWFKLLEWLS